MNLRPFRIVEFSEAGFSAINVPADTALSECLDAVNSPILFGCRTGVCGTCLVEVDFLSNEKLQDPDKNEQEILDLLAPGNSKARLACQIASKVDMRLKRLDE